MERVSFVMQINPGCEEEYKERHKRVFPELLEAFKKVGIQNYSIFMDGTRLFAYLEAENYQQARKRLAEEPSYQKWQLFMKPLMVGLDEKGSTSRFISEVFHLE